MIKIQWKGELLRQTWTVNARQGPPAKSPWRVLGDRPSHPTLRTIQTCVPWRAADQTAGLHSADQEPPACRAAQAPTNPAAAHCLFVLSTPRRSAARQPGSQRQRSLVLGALWTQMTVMMLFLNLKTAYLTQRINHPTMMRKARDPVLQDLWQRTAGLRLIHHLALTVPRTAGPSTSAQKLPSSALGIATLCNVRRSPWNINVTVTPTPSVSCVWQRFLEQGWRNPRDPMP